MADLKIPNLNVKPGKYIFKKKLPLKRKSKRRLINESIFMLISSVIIIYLNYLIPNKYLLLQNLPANLNKSLALTNDLILSLYDIFLMIFIFISLLITFILLLGTFNRLIRVFNRKTRQINYK